MRGARGSSKQNRNGKTKMDIREFSAWVQEQQPAESPSQAPQPIVLGQYVPYTENEDQILQRSQWFSELDLIFSSFVTSNNHQGQHYELRSLVSTMMNAGGNIKCFSFSHRGNECWAQAEYARMVSEVGEYGLVTIQLPVPNLAADDIGRGPDMHRDGWCMLPVVFYLAHFPFLRSASKALYGQPRARVEYNPGMQEMSIEVLPGDIASGLPKLQLIFERAHLKEGEVPYEYTPKPDWDSDSDWEWDPSDWQGSIQRFA